MLPPTVRIFSVVALLSAGALVACGESIPREIATTELPETARSDAGTNASTATAAVTFEAGAPSSEYPAAHPAQPQLVSSGGPVLTAPKFVPITFPNDPFTAEVEDFIPKLAASNYFADATTEYGVGKASALAPVELTEEAPDTIDDEAIEPWLAAQIEAKNSVLPAPDGNTVYVLVYPPGTAVTLGPETSCNDFGGYHYETQLSNGKSVPYVVVPRCTEILGLAGFDAVTGALSHEFVEAATDPYPTSNPAFEGPDAADSVWGALIGGEAGDLCAVNTDAFFTPSDLPFTVQRTWSNVAAAASHDPCAPSTGTYYNAAPVMNDAVSLSIAGASTEGARGVYIPVGGTKTIELDLFSDGATDASWSVHAVDLGPELGSGEQTLDISFAESTGTNGQHLAMTVHVLKPDPMFGGETFLIESKLGTHVRLWWGAIGN